MARRRICGGRCPGGDLVSPGVELSGPPARAYNLGKGGSALGAGGVEPARRWFAHHDTDASRRGRLWGAGEIGCAPRGVPMVGAQWRYAGVAATQRSGLCDARAGHWVHQRRGGSTHPRGAVCGRIGCQRTSLGHHRLGRSEPGLAEPFGAVHPRRSAVDGLSARRDA